MTRQRAIPCAECAGTGHRPMSTIERETYDAVAPTAWASTGAVSLALPDVALTALANRLVRLERLGLLESKLDPDNRRAKLWRRVP